MVRRTPDLRAGPARLALLALLAPFVLGAAPGGASAATLSAETDRAALYVNEHVLLTLSLTGSETRLRAEGVSPNVDLTVLAEDFEIGTPQADFRFNIERHRGRATSSIRVTLFPKRAGRLTIPAFGVDGLTTAPIALDVHPLAADARPEVFTRSGLARERLHTGEQTLLWLDLYHRVDLDSARLGGPLESEPRAVEAHALPAAERTEMVDGFEYRVTRTAWAVSPLVDGEVTFHLPDVWVETTEDRRWRLPLREERLHAVALPAGIEPGTLVGVPHVEAQLPGRARAGEMARWEVTVRSRTALNGLPAELPMASIPGLRVYQDPPLRGLETGADGVESVVRYGGHLLPGTSGEHALPEIRLDWFDPASGAVETTRIPGARLEVAAARSADEAGRDPSPVAAAPAAGSSAGPWPWVALGFALLWLATLGALAWRLRPADAAHPRPARGADAAAGPKGRLLAALGAPTLERGLRQWEAHHGPDPEVHEAVRAVQRLCYRREGRLDPETLARAVDHALSRLAGRRAVPEKPDPDPDTDPWSPRAFHPTPRTPAKDRHR